MVGRGGQATSVEVVGQRRAPPGEVVGHPRGGRATSGGRAPSGTLGEAQMGNDVYKTELPILSRYFYSSLYKFPAHGTCVWPRLCVCMCECMYFKKLYKL